MWTQNLKDSKMIEKEKRDPTLGEEWRLIEGKGQLLWVKVIGK